MIPAANPLHEAPFFHHGCEGLGYKWFLRLGQRQPALDLPPS